jgi:hypothetical protein
VNNELERGARSEVLSAVPTVAYRDCQGSVCPCRDANLVPPAYKWGVLPLGPTCSASPCQLYMLYDVTLDYGQSTGKRGEGSGRRLLYTVSRHLYGQLID